MHFLYVPFFAVDRLLVIGYDYRAFCSRRGIFMQLPEKDPLKGFR
jgi:hypothetical protein